MKLAILLAAVPHSADVRTARTLAAAALRQGHEVTLFLNADGVLSAPAVVGLRQEGAKIAACTLSARQRSIEQTPDITWGSQLDWAEAVRDADRVIALV